MRKLYTDDRTAEETTDPHGFRPVMPEEEPDVPRQRSRRPAHDPWDPAHTTDPRGMDPPTRFADDPHADDPHADDPYTRHGGDTYARYAEDAGAVRPRRRARSRAAARQDSGPHARRAPPRRPPHAETIVQSPDELDTGGGLRIATIAIPVAIGSLVAVGIGVWARSVDPTGVAVNVAGFSSAGAVKTWLATLALAFALVQLWTGLAMRGRVGSGQSARTATVHRWSGRIAVLVTIPVAVQCLIAMGWSGATTRTLVHSLLGCVFYGAFVTKMLLLRRPGVPGWMIAVSGGVLLAVLAGIWLTSALWFFGTKGLSF